MTLLARFYRIDTVLKLIVITRIQFRVRAAGLKNLLKYSRIIIRLLSFSTILLFVF